MSDCGSRTLLAPGERCRSIAAPDSCATHYLELNELAKPCEWRAGVCIAGRARDCPSHRRTAANHSTSRLCSVQGLLDVALLREPPWLCRRLPRQDCGHFYIRLPRPLPPGASAPSLAPAARERPCEWSRGACAAGGRMACLALSRRGGPKRGGGEGGELTREAREELPKLALRRARRAARTSTARLGLPCSSASEGATRTNCEDWCEVRNQSLAHCKLCKCRACGACYSSALPKWATANPTAVRATCALFGSAICNSTGNYSATLGAVTARWNYNHTSHWIDDLFAAHYATMQADRAFVAQTVPVDTGLTAEEVRRVADNS